MKPDAERTILLVENDAGERERVGSWLNDAGYEVLTCPGPTRPDYTCVATRGGTCSLTSGADAVVVNLHLASDVAMEGSPGWQVMLTYYEAGIPCVAVTGAEDPVRPYTDGRVAVVRRPVDRGELLGALHDVLATPLGARHGDDIAG